MSTRHVRAALALEMRRRGWGVQRLARLASLNPSTITGLLGTHPHQATLVRLEEALETPPGFFAHLMSKPERSADLNLPTWADDALSELAVEVQTELERRSRS